MEYAEIPADFPLIPGPPRSPGLHVSDIYDDLNSSLTGVHYDESTANPIWAGCGFVWEETFTLGWKEYCKQCPEHTKDQVWFRPNEVIYDGVIMSPDGIKLTPERTVLKEYKFTWGSARKPPTSNFKWMCQVKSYLLALGITICEMHILYGNGFYNYEAQKDGGHPYEPFYRTCRLTFDQDELMENWLMLKQHAQMRGML